MKGLVVILLIFIAGGVTYLTYSELQKQSAVDEIANRIIQSRVSDGLVAAGGPKAGISEYYNDYGKFPLSWNEARIPIDMVSLPGHIKGIELGDNGEIIIRYYPPALGLPAEVSEATLRLIPEPSSEATYLNWTCVPSGLFGKQRDILPATCWP